MLGHEPTMRTSLLSDPAISSTSLATPTVARCVSRRHTTDASLPSAKRSARGLFQVGHISLYVNRGLGTIGPKARFACSPEITEIALTTKA